MITRSFFCLLLLMTSLLNAQPPAHETTKAHMLSHLEFIKNLFEAKYAPAQWKESHFNWNLQSEYEKTKSKLTAIPNPSIEDYRYLIKSFCNSTQDYHVHVRFYATEEAYLPFVVKGAEGRLFIAHLIEHASLPRGVNLSVGDEIVAINGKSPKQYLMELKEQELGQPNCLTDDALAEILFVHRSAQAGNHVPKGPIEISFRKKGSSKIVTHTFQWSYVSEKISDAPSKKIHQPRALFSIPSSKKHSTLAAFFDKPMMSFYGQKASAIKLSSNPHSMGSRKSFIPQLGRRIWESDKFSIFHAYIAEIEPKMSIGYLRIPHYMGEEIEVKELMEIISLFEEYTDALVIDQINNPGGSAFYLYAIASMLAKDSLYTPQHHIALTQEEANLAVELLDELSSIHNDRDAQTALGSSFGGYPITMDFVKNTINFCKLIIDEWNAGNLYTKPTHVFGVNQIHPHPSVRYTKPVLLLTNSLCFSAADFFPAILKDNERATILGERTAGAGGYILNTQFPNLLGIRDIQITGSFVTRKNGQPIENLGIEPNICYSLSAKDLQENYAEYKAVICNTISQMIREGK